jgi:hypothetical protein
MNEFEQDILKMLEHTAKKDGFSDDFIDSVLLLRNPKQDPHAELKAQYTRDVETCKDIDGLDACKLYQVSFCGDWEVVQAEKIMFCSDAKYRRNPHADNIIAYHKCSDRDKKRWEVRYKGSIRWYDLTKPFFNDDREYRLKPETITINGKEYAAPLRVAPNLDTEYWTVCFCNGAFMAYESIWENHRIDNGRFNAKNCFATHEDCQAVADAFSAILRGDDKSVKGETVEL